MGARKRNSANELKEAKKQLYFAVLKNCPTSPRKMRLVADMVRGMEVNRAIDVLKFSSKESSRRLEKLVMSAIANWQAKNEGSRLEESNLYVKNISVDSGRILKRLRPAPQGRAHRIKKRSNHVTVSLDSLTIVKETE
ncbi:MAG TPA: 50S ribosomal protein L22 [Prolixibacteraceae bacterium]|jgi:large subunit ribosomal protein L22